MARPARNRRISSSILVSVPEDLIRQAANEGEGVVESKEEGEEPAGGWVEDLNGLLGFNKGFRGRYVDVGHEEE